MRKKPYIFKKSDAVRLADPIACFYAEEDERILGDLMEEARVIEKEGLCDRAGESGVAAKWKHDIKKLPY
jgi:hypothetical protein